jgi:hypothetical protein
VERRIAADVIEMMMGVDQVLDRQRRDFRDGCLDLVAEP